MSSSEKPPRGSPYAKELIAFLRPSCVTRTTGRGEQLDLQVNGEGMCYLILEGTVAIYRRSDTLLLSTASSPALFGVANLTDIFLMTTLKPSRPA